jgi:hypothetical protein
MQHNVGHDALPFLGVSEKKRKRKQEENKQ